MDLDQNNDIFLEDFPLNFTADMYRCRTFAQIDRTFAQILLTLLRKLFFAFAQTIHRPFAHSFIRYSIIKSVCLPLAFAR